MWRVNSACAWVRRGNTAGIEEAIDIDRQGYNKKGRHLSVRPNQQRGCVDYFLTGAAGAAAFAGAATTAGADATAAGAEATASGGV
jgi:hypothetical protein